MLRFAHCWEFFFEPCRPSYFFVPLLNYYLVLAIRCETGYFGRILTTLELPLFTGIKFRSKNAELDSDILVRSDSQLGLNHVFFSEGWSLTIFSQIYT